MASLLDSIRAVMGAAKKATAGLAERDRELRRALAEAVRARNSIEHALPPVDVIVANMRRVITETSAAWKERNGAEISRAFGGTTSVQEDGSVRTRRPRLWRPVGEMNQVDLIGQAPGVVAEQLEEAIRGAKVEHGLPLEARAAAIAEADARISGLEEEHSALVAGAAALDPPIRLELLPQVLQARELEARRLELEADRAAQREAAAEAAELRHRRTSGASPYLSPDRERVGA